MTAPGVAPRSATAATIARKLPETLTRWAVISTARKSLTTARVSRTASRGRSQSASGPSGDAGRDGSDERRNLGAEHEPGGTSDHGRLDEESFGSG